jgi:hypothetical protein
MRRWSSFTLVALVASVALAHGALAPSVALAHGATPAPSDDPLTTIQSRFVAAQIISAADAPAFDAQLAANLTLLDPATGNRTFSDLNYNITTPAWWPCLFHIRRVALFAAGWSSPSSTFYQSPTLFSTILGLLDQWLLADYGNTAAPSRWVSPGWWYLQVGIPDGLARTILLPAFQAALLPNQTAAALVQMDAANVGYGCSDANCVWLATNAFYRGLFIGNATLVNASARTVFGTIRVWKLSQGGIQPDNSFGMHGPIDYAGGYGMEYLNGVMHMLQWTAGTPYAETNATALSVFESFVLDGSLRAVSYGAGSSPYGPGLWDIAPIGREIGRPYGCDWFVQAGQAVVFKPDDVAALGQALNTPRLADWLAYASLLNGSGELSVPAPLLTANTAFYVVDYLVHRRPGWMVSLHLSSTRTYRSESINGENLLGWHMGEGASFLQQPVRRNGLEYVDSFPSWDWVRIPGTTVRAWRTGYTASDVGGFGATSFVGFASDGLVGVSAFDFVSPGTITGTTYRKSTSFFDDVVVTLVANITLDPSKAGDSPAWTTLEQRRMPASVAAGQTDVYTSASPSTPIPAGNTSLPATVWWVWEGGAGYIFLDRIPPTVRAAGRTAAAAAAALRASSSSHTAALAASALPVLHVSVATQTGDWASIGAHQGAVNTYTFSLWLEHPSPVLGAAAAYAVVPNIDAAAFAAAAGSYAQNISIVSNTPASQSVKYGNTLALVAYQAGATANGGTGWTVGASAAGAYLVREAAAGTGLTLSASNPAQAAWSTTVSVDRTFTASGSPGGDQCTAGGQMVLPAPYATGASYALTCAIAA